MTLRLARAAGRYRNANTELTAARTELAQAIRAANAAGMRQVDILRVTSNVYTREQIRKICQPTGIDDAAVR